MKICIYGAGAIGGYMGAQLALAGADVSFIARGPHPGGYAGQRRELHIERRSAWRVRCTSDPRELGPQDYVFITLKAHQVPGVVDLMQPLLGRKRPS